MKYGLSLEDEAGKWGFRGVDFDGTLARDDIGSVDGLPAPVVPMVERVRKWLADGDDVIIFTARGWQKEVEDFCLKYFGKKLVVTNIKMRGMAAWYDDRAIHVEPNTGHIVSAENEDNQLRAENKRLKDKVIALEQYIADVEDRFKRVQALVRKLKKDRV
jgi:cell division protein FtsB